MVVEIGLYIVGYSYPILYVADEYRGWALRPDVSGNGTQEGHGFVKVNSDDGIKDSSFADTGKFKGSDDPDCNGKVSKISRALQLEISSNVKNQTGEVIFALDNNRIVSFDKSGNCIDVIDATDAAWASSPPDKPYKPQFMDIRTIDGEDHLFATLIRKGLSGPNKWGYVLTKNLTTGHSKNCYVDNTESPGHYNSLRIRHGKANWVTFDDGNRMYLTTGGDIFRYALKEDGNNYCVDPAKLGSDSKRYHKTSASDCIDVDQHCHAVVIKIDPDVPTLMYLTTFNGGQFQSLRITDTELIPLLPSKVKARLEKVRVSTLKI